MSPLRFVPVALLAVTLSACSTGPATVAASGASSTSGTPTASQPATSSATPTAAPTPATAGATPSPKPSTAVARPRVVKPAPFRFPVPVTLGNATQVITVSARGSYATVTAYQFSRGSWRAVLRTTAARVGTNGVVAASVRRQGTYTTPGGTFTLTQSFGIKPDPGTAVPYHQVTSHDWWVEDNNSPYYNQPRTDTQGGFDMALPESDVNGSEHLITHTVPYQYAVVIDYNRWPAVAYKGAGIFLHVNGAGSTAGCVSVPLATMVALLRWLNPADHPRIAIR